MIILGLLCAWTSIILIGVLVTTDDSIWGEDGPVTTTEQSVENTFTG